MGPVIRHLRRAVLRQDGAASADGQLLAAFINRKDEAAFEALVRRHGPMVFGVCRRIARDHHDAEDAFQAAFLVLARKAASVRPREMVASWLHGVALRLARKANATAAKRRRWEKQVTELPEPAVTPQDPWSDLRPLIDQELSGLPEKYRLPVLLCDLEGKAIKEAARQLGWPQGSLAGRLSRGRKLLARRLTNRGVALGSGSLAAVVSQNAAPAGLPTSLTNFTVKRAVMIAAGPAAAAGEVPSRVAALMEGALKGMLLTRLRKAAGVVLLCLGGLGIGGYQVSQARQTKTTVTSTTTTTTITTTTAGEPARDAVEALTRADDPEVRRRARQLLQALPPKYLLRTFQVTGMPVHALAVSPNGRLVAASGGLVRNGDGYTLGTDSDVRLINRETGKEVRRLSTGGRAGGCLAFSPDGKLLAACAAHAHPRADRSIVFVWDVSSGRALHRLKGHDYVVSCVTFSPGGRRILTCGWDRTIRLWDAKTGEEIRQLGHGQTDWQAVAFLPGGREAVACGLSQGGAALVTLDVESGAVVRSFPWWSGRLCTLSVSPDGERLLTTCADGADGRARLWDVGAGKLLREFDVPDEPVVTVPRWPHGAAIQAAFLPDGRRFVMACNDHMHLRDARTGKILHTFKNHTDAVLAVAVAARGAFAVSAGLDETVNVWRLAD
jgi:RNA polymerase sigma factor (sigma-70 family)